MRNLIKTILLMLITSVTLNAQISSDIEMDETRTVFDKSFSTTKTTTFVIDLEDTSVIFKTSNDGKLHINYTMEFKNYKKKTIEELLKRYKLKADKEGDKITFVSKINLPKNHYRYEWEEVFYNSKLAINNQKKESENILRKTKDSLLNEINESDWDRILKFSGKVKVRPNVQKWKKSNKLYTSKMIISIPPFINIRANVINSKVFFEDDLINFTTIKSKNSKLKFKELNNQLNKFVIDGGKFKANKISNGNYMFSSVREVLIGNVESVTLNSEFSKIEIGEIGKQTKIKDFNSEYWFYNWSQDFQSFDLNSEYSKIHLFYPKANHSIKVVGNNTRHIIGKDFVANLQPTKKGEKYLMMTKEPHPGKTISGEIFFDIVHGIIYTHEDSIKTINK